MRTTTTAEGRTPPIGRAIRDARWIGRQAFLHVGGRAGRKPAERVRRLVGSLNSGVLDLAERHREYIIEALERGR